MATERNPISEDWLKSVGFKWHQFDRQPAKHWLLWLGDAAGGGMFTSHEDIGIEVTTMRYENGRGEMVGRDEWFVWFRSDAAGRYHRFIHVRHMRWQDELVKLIEAISGQDWNPENHLYGSVRTPARAAAVRAEDQRLDRRMQRDSKWYNIEKDDTRGRALPEHYDAYVTDRAPAPGEKP